MEPVTSRIKPDEQRKQQIRAAATRCFVRRGFAATRLLDIAREAGLSKGGVYFHYRAKESLFHDIIEAQFAALVARWDSQEAADLPPEEALAGLVRVHLQTYEDPDEARFCSLMLTMATQELEFREMLDHALNAMHLRYVEILHRGMAAKVFATDAAEQLASGIIALIYGLAVQSASDGQARLPVRTEEGVAMAVRLARGPV